MLPDVSVDGNQAFVFSLQGMPKRCILTTSVLPARKDTSETRVIARLACPVLAGGVALAGRWAFLEVALATISLPKNTYARRNVYIYIYIYMQPPDGSTVLRFEGYFGDEMQLVKFGMFHAT